MQIYLVFFRFKKEKKNAKRFFYIFYIVWRRLWNCKGVACWATGRRENARRKVPKLKFSEKYQSKHLTLNEHISGSRNRIDLSLASRIRSHEHGFPRKFYPPSVAFFAQMGVRGPAPAEKSGSAPQGRFFFWGGKRVQIKSKFIAFSALFWTNKRATVQRGTQIAQDWNWRSGLSI